MAINIVLFIVPFGLIIFLAMAIGLSAGLRGRCNKNNRVYGRTNVPLAVAISSQQQRQQQQQQQQQQLAQGQSGYGRGVAPPPYAGYNQQPGGYTQPGAMPQGPYNTMAPHQGQPQWANQQKGPPHMGPPPPSYSSGASNPVDAAYPPLPPGGMPGVSE